MALLSSLLGQTPSKTSFFVQLIVPRSPLLREGGWFDIDCTIRESYQHTLEVTSSEVESGAAITDHARKLPDRFSIEGVVTDSPATFLAGRLGALGRRSQDAYDLLYKLQEARQPFDVVLGLRIARNVLLEDFAPVREKGTGRALRFTASLREIRFADSISGVALLKSAAPVAAAAAKKELGSQATQVVDDPQKSWAAGLYDLGKALLGGVK